MREQSAGIEHTAQMTNMDLRTGLSERAARKASDSFRDVMQMAPEEALPRYTAHRRLASAPLNSLVPQIRVLFATRSGDVSLCADAKGLIFIFWLGFCNEEAFLGR